MRTPILILATLSGCIPRSALNLNGDVHNTRCAALVHTQDLAQARAECQLALEYNPDSPEALVNMGLIEYREGHNDAARAAWIKAARTDNESAQAYNNLGVLALDEGDIRVAESRFERALKVNPAYLEARKNLVVSQVRLHKLDEAERTLRTMIALAPQLSEPYHDRVKHHEVANHRHGVGLIRDTR